MPLDVGASAPDFTLSDQHGQRVTLSTLVADRAVLIAFYPFAFSGVCTGELRDLRDHADRIAAAGAELMTISCDPMFALRVFADQDGLQFPLLSDFWPHGEVSRAYDAFDEQHGCPTRSTFVVDRDGVLRWSVRNPMGEARSLDDYVAALDQLHASQGT